MRGVVVLFSFLFAALSHAADNYEVHDFSSQNAGDFVKGQIWIEIKDWNKLSYNSRVNTLDRITLSETFSRNLDYLKVFAIPNENFIGTGYNVGMSEYCKSAKCNELPGLKISNKPQNTKLTNRKLTDLQILVAEEFYRTFGEFEEDEIWEKIGENLGISAAEAEKNFIHIYFELKPANYDAVKP